MMRAYNNNPIYIYILLYRQSHFLLAGRKYYHTNHIVHNNIGTNDSSSMLSEHCSLTFPSLIKRAAIRNMIIGIF